MSIITFQVHDSPHTFNASYNRRVWYSLLYLLCTLECANCKLTPIIPWQCNLSHIPRPSYVFQCTCKEIKKAWSIIIIPRNGSGPPNFVTCTLKTWESLGKLSYMYIARNTMPILWHACSSHHHIWFSFHWWLIHACQILTLCSCR